MTKVTANDQAYQSIYINPNASTWQETIVFHEPIFDDAIPPVIALKSLRLEDCLGFVLAAPKSRLRYFREKIKDIDSKEQLGKQQPREILKKLLLLSEEISGTITYIQNEHVNEPKEDIEGIKAPPKKKREPKRKPDPKSKQQKETDSFFDPLTKRQLITKGPQYFDPSLPTMDKIVTKSADAKARFLYSPAINTYPDNIRLSNISLWNKAVSKVLQNGFPVESNNARWKLVSSLYEKICHEIEVPAYNIKSLTDKDEIKKDISNRIGFARRTLQTLAPDNAGKIRLRLKDVIASKDYFSIVLETKYIRTKTLDEISEQHGFKHTIIATHRNILKQLDDRTSLTLTHKKNDIVAQVVYVVSSNEACRLFDFNTSNPEKLRLGIINIARKYG